MKKKDLVRIIREVVKLEIKSAVKREINEVLTAMENGSQKPLEEKTYTRNTMLNEVLNSTEQEQAWPEISKNELRNRFAGMQGGTPMTDLNNRPVDTANLDPSLNNALNRDYSELVKRFSK
tara:strand:+ start:8862 stop:9224 length:363 start_codon:yes stop_codon:yes gene_type:complete